MKYKVIISNYAQSQLDDYAAYLLIDLLNPQAFDNLLQDAEDTATELEYLAGTMRYCSDSDLRALGYHSIPLKRHKYVLLYEIVGNYVYVEAMYHQTQDYENIFKEYIL